jgi:hypothetical protein
LRPLDDLLTFRFLGIPSDRLCLSREIFLWSDGGKVLENTGGCAHSQVVAVLGLFPPWRFFSHTHKDKRVISRARLRRRPSRGGGSTKACPPLQRSEAAPGRDRQCRIRVQVGGQRGLLLTWGLVDRVIEQIRPFWAVSFDTTQLDFGYVCDGTSTLVL